MRFEEFSNISGNSTALHSAVVFHRTLNPLLFDKGRLKPEIRKAMLDIAKDFQEYVDIDFDITDIRMSGSNAAFSYTTHSDIDLHLIVDFHNDETLKALLQSKKTTYNTTYHITIKNIDVEVYAQDINEEHVSLGIYSVLHNKWIHKPVRKKLSIDDTEVIHKYHEIKHEIQKALKTKDMDQALHIKDKIKAMRKASLDKYGEFGVENLAFKMLRTNGFIEMLFNHINALKSKELSVENYEN